MAAAELLIMPSYLESLSMVALEAWAMGKPVLANAKCDVLQGQCLRSNAGLFYENFHEFAETLRAIDTHAQPAGGARPQRPRLLRAPLRVAGDREEVRRHARSSCRRNRRRGRWSRCRAGSRAGGDRSRRPIRS